MTWFEVDLCFRDQQYGIMLLFDKLKENFSMWTEE